MSDLSKTLNFKDGAFFNAPPFSQLREGTNQLDLAKKFVLTRVPDGMPKGRIPVLPITGADLAQQKSAPETHIYRLGHSSILMKFNADYWLVDPVFSKRASPSSWFGPKRFHSPPIDIADMPDIKALVISHNHYDHLDRTAIKRLANKVEKFIVPLGVANILTKWGVDAGRVVELDWWQNHNHAGVNVTATPTQHFSGRGLRDTNKTLWTSYVFENNGDNIFFGSDSGYFSGFKTIGQKFGRFAVTMLECGAYDTAWPDVHMTPAQTIAAHKDLGGGVLMPIHNSTFKLAFHSWKDPLEQLEALTKQANTTLLTPRFGERVVLGETAAPNLWWHEVD